MLIAERFLSGLVKIHGKHIDQQTMEPGIPLVCKFPKLEHHLHLLAEKIEKPIRKRTMQHVKKTGPKKI